MSYLVGVMIKGPRTQQNFDFVESPTGIFTTDGHWFHITRDQVDGYAPGLTDAYSMGVMLKDAEEWVVSSDNVSLVIFLLLSLFMNCIFAGIIALVFFPFWHYNKSAFVSFSSTKVIKLINVEMLLVLLAVLMISIKGIHGEYIQVVVGFLFFFFFKFGWFRSLVNRWKGDELKGIPLNDRIMRMIILKYSLHEGIDLKEKNVNQWEKDIQNLLRKRKKKKKP
ncbi:MAG TPA: hypothetical protein VKA08_19095 [Balneolales bacterium]|nr:hypothetical protein [Balneolales bacterium]